MSEYGYANAGTLHMALAEAEAMGKALETKYWECLEKMEDLGERLAAACARLAELGEDVAECREKIVPVLVDGPSLDGYVLKGGYEMTKPDDDCWGGAPWIDEGRPPSAREAFGFHHDLMRVCRCLADGLPPDLRIVHRTADWPRLRALEGGGGG